jgi:hypothetical protein
MRSELPRDWSATWETKIRDTVTRDGEGWVAYLRLEDPPGLSPITTVGRFDTVEATRCGPPAAHREPAVYRETD